MLNVEGSGVVDLIDAAYDMEVDEQVWLERVLGALMAIASSDSAAFFRLRSFYGPDGGFRQHAMGEATLAGPYTVWNRSTLRTIASAPSSEALFGRTQGVALSQATGLGPRVPEIPGWRDCWREPIVDSLGIVARDACGDGFCACAGLEATLSLSPRESGILMRLSAHLGAGDRLRRQRAHGRIPAKVPRSARSGRGGLWSACRSISRRRSA